MKTIVIDEPMHEWFGLTYASYLVVSRTAIQSMPTRWQKNFRKLLDEMDASIDFPENIASFRVQALNSDGKFTEDPLRDYERGRRRLPLKKLNKKNRALNET